MEVGGGLATWGEVLSAPLALTSKGLSQGTLPLQARILSHPSNPPHHPSAWSHFFMAELPVCPAPCLTMHRPPPPPRPLPLSQALTARASSSASTRRFCERYRGAETSLLWRACSWRWPSWPCCWCGPGGGVAGSGLGPLAGREAASSGLESGLSPREGT